MFLLRANLGSPSKCKYRRFIWMMLVKLLLLCIHLYGCIEKLRRREELSGGGGDEKVIEPNTCVHFLFILF